jgi:hypothetical protein
LSQSLFSAVRPRHRIAEAGRVVSEAAAVTDLIWEVSGWEALVVEVYLASLEIRWCKTRSG